MLISFEVVIVFKTFGHADRKYDLSIMDLLSRDACVVTQGLCAGLLSFMLQQADMLKVSANHGSFYTHVQSTLYSLHTTLGS